MDWDRIRNISSIKDLAPLGVAQVGGVGISAIFWFYMAALMGTELYGELSYLISIAVVASAIALVGAPTTVTVYSAKGVKIIPAISILALSCSAIIAIIIAILFDNIHISFYVISYVIYNIGLGALLGRKFYKKYAKYFLFQKGLMFAFGISLYFVMGINGIILGYAISHFIFIKIILDAFKNSTIDFKTLRPKLGFMLNSYGNDLARTFSGSIDKLMIGPIFGFAILGNYHLGIQFLGILSIIPGVVIQYLLPEGASGVSKTKLKKITVASSIIFAVLGFILAPIVIPFFFPEYEKATIILQIISIAIIPRTITGILSAKFFGNEKSRLVFSSVLIFLVIQIPGIIILGEMLDIVGIAISLVLADIGQAIFLLIMNWRTKNE